MTDRELLKLAAKASGILNASWSGNEAYFDGVITRWNPLNDDGDALRLAVKLGIFVCRGSARLAEYDYPGSEWIVEGWVDDPTPATRRAIVMAAAEIGQGMA